MDFDPYKNLAAAIVEKAVIDYQKALRRHRKYPNNEFTLSEIAELERFFRSSWCRMLTDIDGEVIIEKIQQMEGMVAV